MTTTPSRALVLLFAFAGGAAVGNLYWAQPLLEFISADLHSSAAAAGWLVTATQVGYALGILLIVPLGDVLDRRRLVPAVMLAASATLVVCAVAPTFPVLLVAIFVLGLTTVSGQVLTPLAGDLASDGDRGRVVGTVAAGLLAGILVSRTISGFVADLAGWRAIFVGAAVLDLVLALVLLRSIPRTPSRPHPGYARLIASVGSVVARERALRWTLVLGATGFGCFSMFWTALTLLLSSEPFDYDVSTIGLFGLVGLVGVVAAQRAGRLHDRGLSLPATGVAWAGMFVAFAAAWLGARSVVLVVVAIVVLDASMQTANILNQTRALAIAPAERSRVNTAYVVSNFIGGAVGSAVASVLWAAGGWHAVSLAGMVASLAALGVWAVGRRGPLVLEPVEPGSLATG